MTQFQHQQQNEPIRNHEKNVLPIDKEINMVGFKYSTDVETNHGVLKITTK